MGNDCCGRRPRRRRSVSPWRQSRSTALSQTDQRTYPRSGDRHERDIFVRKPVHVREILARVGAVMRRHECERESAVVGDLRVFFDGRDPQLKGVPLQLSQRERRILEYLVNNRGRRVNKAQILNSIYGFFDGNVKENVVESHINKLRKVLRRQLGYDPINSVRYLGYRLDESIGGSSDPVGRGPRLHEGDE